MTTDHDAHPTRPTSGPEYWALMARENVAGVESVLAYKFEQVERLQAQVEALEAELEQAQEAFRSATLAGQELLTKADALEQRIADLEEVLARERSLSDGISDRYSDLEQRIVELEGERLPAAALRALDVEALENLRRALDEGGDTVSVRLSISSILKHLAKRQREALALAEPLLAKLEGTPWVNSRR